jgi:hypothetical protein
LEDGLDALDDVIEGFIPGDAPKGLIEGVSHHWIFQPIFVNGFGNGSAFDANFALTGGMIAIAPDLPNWIALFIPIHRFSRQSGGQHF